MKKILAIILTTALIFSVISVGVSAADVAEVYEPELAENTATTEDLKLNLNEEVVVHIREDAGKKTLSFTPDESGWYLFTSLGDYYTKANLYNSKDELLNSNESSRFNDNFVIIEELNAGEEYKLEVSHDDPEVWGGFSVKVINAPEISNLVVNPITLTENAGGEWMYDYFAYEWWRLMSYTLTLKDGTVIKGKGEGFEYKGIKIPFAINKNSQTKDNNFTVGNIYTEKVCFTDKEFDVQLKVEESPIKSIKINPVTVIEKVDGLWEKTNGKKYYAYYWWNNITYTVTMQNGDTVKGEGTTFEYNKKEYDLYYKDSQSINSQWTCGNTYKATVLAGANEYAAKVTVKEIPVKSIKFNSVSIVDGTKGGWVSDSTCEADLNKYEYYRYNWDWLLTYTVTMKDGTTIKGEDNYFDYKGVTYELNYSDPQSFKNQWKPNNSYSVAISVNDSSVKANLKVNITESAVKSIKVEPIILKEGVDGYYKPDGDEEIYGPKYLYYPVEDYLEYTVTMKDGVVKKGYSNYFSHKGIEYNLTVKHSQSYENSWKPGNTYTATVYIDGSSVKTDVKVTILESPIKSINFEPITVVVNKDGSEKKEYNENSGEYEKYFKYNWENNLIYTFITKDGTEIKGEGDCFDYDDEEYFLECTDTQSLNNQWTVGNTYNATVTFQNIKYDVTVTVDTLPIEKIEFKPINILEYSNGENDYDYDIETDEDSPQYYKYDFENKLSYTVTMKDGTTIEDTGTYFKYKGSYYRLKYQDPQSYNNQWTKNNTYNVEITVDDTDVKANAQITIEEVAIKSIEFAPITITAFTNGYWDDGYSDDFFVYSAKSQSDDCNYKYKWREKLIYTITMKDGTVIQGQGDSFEYKGETFDFKGDFSQKNTIYKEGKKYTETLTVCGFSANVKINIAKSPIKSITVNPLKMSENNGGYIYETYNEKTDAFDLKYFIYEWYDDITYTVKMKDGTTIKASGESFVYNGEEFFFNHEDAFTSYSNRWVKGKTYTETMDFGVCKVKAKISIIANPVAKVNFSPFYMSAGYDADIDMWYNPETDKDDLEYLVYKWWDKIPYTVTMKDGTVVKAKGTTFNYKGVKYHLGYDEWQQSYYNKWVSGKTYTESIYLAGITTKVKITISPETLQKENGKWYYLLNGKKTNATKLVNMADKTYYVINGVWSNKIADTLYKIDGKWYYIKDGKFASNETTIVKYKGTWYYVEKGIKKTATKLVKYNGKYYYVKSGKVSFTTGIKKVDGKYYYIKNGKWSKSTTLYKKDGKYYVVKSGMWYKSKAIIKYSGKKYYVNKGYAQTKYSGKVKIGSKTYTVKKGIVK